MRESEKLKVASEKSKQRSLLTLPFTLVTKLGIILEMIKFEHTIFAMPFALTAAVVAAHGIPAWGILGWIVVAMVGARSAAMTFNRIADAKFDADNPRTAGRAIPKGLVSTVEAWVFLLVTAGLLVLAAGMLNRLALFLSPVALAVVLGYSYTKRFTSWSHIVLGTALGIVPVGAWIAITGKIELAPIILAACVTFWTGGFDIIYSLQDVEFDKKAGLFSLPKALGPAKALFVSRILHTLMLGILIWFGMATGLGIIYYVGIGLVALAIIYEHTLVSPNDLSKLNVAFFTMNGCVSLGLFVFAFLDVMIRR